MEPKTTPLMFTSTKLQRMLIISLLFLLLTTTANAKEYIVSPIPSDQPGVSLDGEKGVELEVTTEPYWQFVLWLAAMQILSIVDTLQLPAKLLFTILGFKVTDHSNTGGFLKRKKIFSFIKANPGTCIREIASYMDISRGTLRYHLAFLEEKNLVETFTDQGKNRYFQNNSTYDENEKVVLSILQNEIPRKIVFKILYEECKTNGDLAREIGISKNKIRWHMKQLNELGLVEKNKVGRSTIYSIDPAYRDALKKMYIKFFE